MKTNAEKDLASDATHQDLDSGEYIHIDNGVFVLIDGEWIQDKESKPRRLKAVN